MKLLFLNRCYWPDVEASGQQLTDLCGRLAERHEVTVIAGQPNAAETSLPGKETHAGVRIVRVGNRRFRKTSIWSRAFGLLSYLLLAAWAALRQACPEVIVVETDPPLLGALGAILKRWHRCALVFYIQDLYPEVGIALGRLRPGLMTRLLDFATQVGLRAADRVVVLGEDMRRLVLRRGIDPAKIVVVPNWTDTRAVYPLPPEQSERRVWELDGQFVVMYSGNIGLSQNLEPLLEAARRLKDLPVMFVLIGEGAAKARLEARVREWSLGNVRFLPFQPRERLSASLAAADLHFIPLRRGLAGCLVPSKLYGILAAGLPYLASVDPESDVALVTKEHQTGLLIEPDSGEQLEEAIRWSLGHRDELRAMGTRGRKIAEQRFDLPIAVDAFERVLSEARIRISRDERELATDEHR